MPQTIGYEVIPQCQEPQVFTHIVTLINRRTEDEKCFKIETLSIRFADVVREVCCLKVAHKLLGYEIHEVLDCNDAF